MEIVVIDPGHGGTVNIGGSDANHGVGVNGTLEKTLTLALGVKVAEILNHLGYKVFLTRNSDSNLSLADRARVASDNSANVFVSIHFNAFNNASVQGTETHVHNAASDDSKLLASSIQSRVVNVTGYSNRGLRYGQWGVLTPSIHNPTTSACLLEVSFLTDPNDEARLMDANYKLEIANAISQAIIDYLKRSTNITPLTPTATQGDNEEIEV